MLRVLVFFVLAFLLAGLLGQLPLIGPLFRNSGLIGILISAALLSVVLTRVGERLVGASRLRSELRALEAVGNAYNHGKIGTAYLARGRPRKAREHLEQAVAGEPQVPEWHYRLGLARMGVGDTDGALEAFEHCVGLDEEYGYGTPQMRRAECLQRLGHHPEALTALEVFERNHGPSPEASYRRGRVLRALGRRDEARAAFDEVGELARQATRYQRRSAAMWALRAGLARFV